MIDSHHHLWSYSKEQYPWIPPDSALAKDHLILELEAATAAAGVDGTVVVQARQTLAETDWLLDLADQTPIIQGVVGWVPLIDPNVEESLGKLTQHPAFKGVRHVLQEECDEYFHRDDFHRGLATFSKHRLPYDLLIFQRQLPAAIQLVDRQPQLNIILDHIAKPEIRNGSIDPFWKKHMRTLAERDNLIGVKISGMATEVLDPEIDPQTLRAYFEETLEIFGPDRLMFGTDWPVCLLRIDSYQSWAETVRHFVADLTEIEQQDILHHNATRCYQLPI